MRNDYSEDKSYRQVDVNFVIDVSVDVVDDLKPCLRPGIMRNAVRWLVFEQRPLAPDAVGRYAAGGCCTPPSRCG